LLEGRLIEAGGNFNAQIRGQRHPQSRGLWVIAGGTRYRRHGHLNQGNGNRGLGDELPAPVDELMKLQLMPSAVFGLAQPACLPAGNVSVPVAALLLQFLLTNGVFSHGSSCDGENDVQPSQ
jgi:hypothetical protein